MHEDVFLAAELKHDLPEGVLAAIAEQESSTNTYAIRYEPAFFTRYIGDRSRSELGGAWPSGVSEATERMARSTSWGLLQVMGQVARQEGFAGRFISELCAPENGVEFGARHLARHLKRYAGDLPKALSAYNAGTATDRNRASYVDPILNRMKGA